MADQAAAAHALAPTESSTAVATAAVTAAAAIATATTTAPSSPHRAAVVGKAEVPKTAFPAIDKVLAMMRTRLDIPARAPPPESDDDDYGDDDYGDDVDVAPWQPQRVDTGTSTVEDGDEGGGVDQKEDHTPAQEVDERVCVIDSPAEPATFLSSPPPPTAIAVTAPPPAPAPVDEPVDLPTRVARTVAATGRQRKYVLAALTARQHVALGNG